MLCRLDVFFDGSSVYSTQETCENKGPEAMNKRNTEASRQLFDSSDSFSSVEDEMVKNVLMGKENMKSLKASAN